MAAGTSKKNCNKTVLRFVFIAFALLFNSIVLFSVPTFPTMDIARVSFNTSTTVNGTNGVRQLRFGVWSYCVERVSTNNTPCDFLSPCDFEPHGHLRLCTSRKYQYEMSMTSPPEAAAAGHSAEVKVTSTWTRALVAHASAGAFLAISTILVIIFRTHWIFILLSFISAIIGCLSNFAFYFHIQHIFKKFNFIGAAAKTGAGLWMAPIYTLLILFEIGFTLLDEEERESARNMSGPYQWARRPRGLFERPSDSLAEPEEETTGNDSGDNLFDCQACWVAHRHLYALPCTHVFCEECIKQYVRMKNVCFLCGIRWTKDDIHKVEVLTQHR